MALTRKQLAALICLTGFVLELVGYSLLPLRTLPVGALLAGGGALFTYGLLAIDVDKRP
jgi:hypothetical protein